MHFCKKNRHVWEKMPIEGAIHLRSHILWKEFDKHNYTFIQMSELFFTTMFHCSVDCLGFKVLYLIYYWIFTNKILDILFILYDLQIYRRCQSLRLCNMWGQVQHCIVQWMYYCKTRLVKSGGKKQQLVSSGPSCCHPGLTVLLQRRLRSISKVLILCLLVVAAYLIMKTLKYHFVYFIQQRLSWYYRA